MLNGYFCGTIKILKVDTENFYGVEGVFEVSKEESTLEC